MIKIKFLFAAAVLSLPSWITPLPASCQIQTQTQTQTASPTSGHFLAEVSGSVQLKFEGECFLVRSPAGDWSLSLEGREKEDSPPWSILLVLPGRIKAGTYEIKDYEHAFNEGGRVVSVAAAFSSLQMIGVNAAGALNLTEASPTYSGNFEFTAESFDKKQTISVKGSFDKVPVQKKKEPKEKKE